MSKPVPGSTPRPRRLRHPVSKMIGPAPNPFAWNGCFSMLFMWFVGLVLLAALCDWVGCIDHSQYSPKNIGRERAWQQEQQFRNDLRREADRQINERW